VEISLLSPSDEAWAETLEHGPHDIYHLPAYASLEANRQGGRALGVLIHDNNTRLLLPWILIPTHIGGNKEPSINSWDATSPYGYPAPLIVGKTQNIDAFMDKALTTLKEEMASQKIATGFLRMHPLLQNQNSVLNHHGTVVQHGETIWLDLTLPNEELWRQTRKQTRNAINRLTAQGLTSRVDNSFTHYGYFRKIYYKTMNQADAANWYYFNEAYFQQLRDSLGKHLSLAIVEDGDGRICAGALFTETNGLVQYHLAATASDHPYRESMKLLLHFARTWFKERGNRAMHLGGGLSAEHDSLFLFKSGFSKLRSPFHTWRTIFNENLYREAIQCWEEKSGRQAGDITKYFPPYHLPW